MKAAVPANEEERLCALRAYDILDTSPEAAFNDITHLAAYICRCPIATISLIDQDRQWYKAKIGMDMVETPRDIAFCAHTILSNHTVVVPDTLLDPRFSDNPVVVEDPHIRFYAGVPLVNRDGFPLGTLCVVDVQPRHLDFDQAWALESLRTHVVAHLELRRSLLEQRKMDAEIQSLNETLKIEVALRTARMIAATGAAEDALEAVHKEHAA